MLKDHRDSESQVPSVPDAPQGAPAPARACSVAACLGRYLARGYCIKHYYQVKRHGEVLADGIRSRRREPSGGLLPGTSREGSRVRRAPAPRRSRDGACLEPACDEGAFSHGLCRLHYIMTRYQDLLA